MRTADEIDILEMRIRGLERELRDMRETLRDKFAMAAMNHIGGLQMAGMNDLTRQAVFTSIAQFSYEMADAMLAARTVHPTPKDTHDPAAP